MKYRMVVAFANIIYRKLKTFIQLAANRQLHEENVVALVKY